MLRFIANCFAVIGLLFVAAVVAGVAYAVKQHGQTRTEPASIVLTVDFDLPIVEQSTSSPFNLTSGEDPMVLLDVLKAIDFAAKDPKVKGIAARFGSGQASLAQAQEIRSALSRFRSTGKFSYAYGSDFGAFGLGSRAYFLASAFENIWLQPVGTVSLTGLSLKAPFIKGTLDKLGVVADFMQREEYKSLMEVAQREDFSSPAKEEMKAMVHNLSGQIAKGIAESRKWDVDHVKNLMARGPFTDEEAVQEGLVTKLAYLDELIDELEKKAGKEAENMDVSEYLALVSRRERKQKDVTAIALIYGTGMIVERGFGDGGIGGERIIGADVVSGAFADAIDDDNIKAILFRIDSPGGSPAASETIRRAMTNAQKKGKPVIVSMADTAASGGYWIAMNADKIVADPATLTGSIGVVSGKFAVDGLLQKAGVTLDGVSTTPNAGMWNVLTPFTPEQRARVNALLDNTYRAFVANVSEARKIPADRMPDVAKGRVFTGEQALAAGLVDALGGYDIALREVRSVLKLDSKAPLSLIVFPELPSTAERILKLLQRLSMEGPAALSFASRLDVFVGAFLNMTAYARFPIALYMHPMEVGYD